LQTTLLLLVVVVAAAAAEEEEELEVYSQEVVYRCPPSLIQLP
jgi:Tfp pilus assembly protein PilP